MSKLTTKPLLHAGSDSEGPELPGHTTLLLSFVVMSIAFSLNHGTVTALIALAAPNQGNLGRTATGTLYVLYTVVAMFFSTLIVHFTGHKWGLFWGLVVYCVYVVSNMIYNFTDTDAIGIVGAGIGGIAAGFLWTAQGGYFSTACDLYAQSHGVTKEKASGTLGGIFAFIYLTGEVGLKLLSSAIQDNVGETTVYVTFSIVAVASAVMMAFVKDLEQYKPRTVEPPVDLMNLVTTKIVAAGQLLFTDPKMMLLLPAQISFGFLSTFINSYSNANIIKPALGSGNVGYMAAIIAGTAAILSMPLGWLTNHISKVYVMVFGGLVFILEGAIFYSYSDEHLGKWSWAILLYMVHGTGRCVWESTNKAVMADFFPGQAPAAFANVIMSSGGATSIGFFLFPHISRDTQLMICLVSSVLHVVCAVFAFALYKQRRVLSSSEHVMEAGKHES